MPLQAARDRIQGAAQTVVVHFTVGGVSCLFHILYCAAAQTLMKSPHSTWMAALQCRYLPGTQLPVGRVQPERHRPEAGRTGKLLKMGWWRRRELNPRPKKLALPGLRAYPIRCLSAARG